MSTAVKKTVELFYDVLSPYSWIAFEVLCRYRIKWNIDLQFKPMFLAGIMEASGNKPPAQVAAKGRYMAKDLHYLSQYYKVPVKMIADPMNVIFVKGSLPTQRFLTAVQMQRPELTESLSREIWMRIWHRDEDIVSPESLQQAGRKVGLSDSDIEVFLKQIKEDSVKEKLKQTTQQAIDAGAFGSPWILLHDGSNKTHVVFGSDRMHIVAMLLGEEYVGPLNELSQSRL